LHRLPQHCEIRTRLRRRIEWGIKVIPAAFDYVRADSVDAALSALTEYGDEAKLLAGGHSLIPLMKLRLAAPSVLVDVGRLDDLRYINDAGDYIAIGALTRHRDLETSSLLASAAPLLAHAAGHVGDPQVRHRGTIGGSLAHADPASDLPAVALAMGATIVATGPNGTREIAASEFYTGFLESALAPDELLTEIRIPKLDTQGWSFQKFNRRAQDWAIVGVATVRANGSTGVGLVNMGSTPLLASAVMDAVKSGANAADAAALANEGTEAQSDINASSEYREHLARVLVRRSLEESGLS
jgi:carbon-monoxide dehydrogenase medium subunit